MTVLLLAAIPYKTFPSIEIGPLHIHTFGLMVAIGVIAGITIAARHGERFGADRNEVVNLGAWLVVAGVVGARITWDLTHISEIHSPLDLIALWKGGLQFSGGFIAAVLVAYPRLRRLGRETRWRLLDGLALGLTVGLAMGRIGCYSVGEHLGHPTSFFLGVRYEGGATREGPLVIGQVIHSTALYEFMHLAVLAGILAWLMYRRRGGLPPGMALGIFALWYGVARFLTDFLRAYDHKVLGLTGAQWMCLALVPIGTWLIATARRRTDEPSTGESVGAPSLDEPGEPNDGGVGFPQQ